MEMNGREAFAAELPAFLPVNQLLLMLTQPQYKRDDEEVAAEVADAVYIRQIQHNYLSVLLQKPDRYSELLKEVFSILSFPSADCLDNDNISINADNSNNNKNDISERKWPLKITGILYSLHPST